MEQFWLLAFDLLRPAAELWPDTKAKALCSPGLKRRSCCCCRPVRWRNLDEYLSSIHEVVYWDANITLLEEGKTGIPQVCTQKYTLPS